MVRRYDYGVPINTGAVVKNVSAQKGGVPYFDVNQTEEGLVFSVSLDKEDMIFGLGESVRGLNKRGHRYTMWAKDEGGHTETMGSLYASHTFVIFVKKDKTFGVFFNDPGEMFFDLGCTEMDKAAITSVNGDLSVYIIDELASAVEICRELRGLTGRSYIPPKWAMGYIQSRWGYKTDEDIRRILKEHRDRHIPLDGLSMDIDYMLDYKDFTWDPAKFPDMPKLSRDMKEQHARLVPIIDAGLKLEKGYDLYDEGVEQELVCTKADGTPFIGAVWPGRCVFPDFLKPEARKWFGEKYHRLLAAGVEGFWNDMNEPALFYSDDSLAEAFEKVDSLKGKNLDITGAFAIQAAVNGMAQSRKDYRRFYQVTEGRKVCHEQVHNLYGAHMTRAASEGFQTFDPEKRFLLFSRSSFIGSHRYGGVWQGDNCSWWIHILLNLRELASLNMCGYIYNGADLGGFGCDTTGDLLARWLQLGVFTPLMRNHSAWDTRQQEIYQFENWKEMRDTIGVRYALLPYLYSEMMKAVLADGLMFRPLAFDYPADKMACHVEDQLMLGADCMIAPVYEQNAVGRYVYLPEDMLMIRFEAADRYELIPMEAGHHWIDLELNQFPLFVRKNHIIPLAKAAEYVEGVDSKDLTMIGWVDKGMTVAAELYDDDGFTTQPKLEKGLTRIEVTVGETITCTGNGLKLNTEGIIC